MRAGVERPLDRLPQIRIRGQAVVVAKDAQRPRPIPRLGEPLQPFLQLRREPPVRRMAIGDERVVLRPSRHPRTGTRPCDPSPGDVSFRPWCRAHSTSPNPATWKHQPRRDRAPGLSHVPEPVAVLAREYVAHPGVSPSGRPLRRPRQAAGGTETQIPARAAWEGGGGVTACGGGVEPDGVRTWRSESHGDVLLVSPRVDGLRESGRSGSGNVRPRCWVIHAVRPGRALFHESVEVSALDADAPADPYRWEESGVDPYLDFQVMRTGVAGTRSVR